MNYPLKLVTVAIVTALSACAVAPPRGPSVMVLPGSNKSFDQFAQDQAVCQQYAQAMVGQTTPGQAATDDATKNAALGTAIGAAAGALLGAASGNAAAGAAIGAGGGLILGSASGSEAGGVAANNVQDRYDIAYIQCMYGKGHQVPVRAGYQQAQPAQPPAQMPPPPPPRTNSSGSGYYPPPPPTGTQPPPY